MVHPIMASYISIQKMRTGVEGSPNNKKAGSLFRLHTELKNGVAYINKCVVGHTKVLSIYYRVTKQAM